MANTGFNVFVSYLKNDETIFVLTFICFVLTFTHMNNIIALLCSLALQLSFYSYILTDIVTEMTAFSLLYEFISFH